MNIPYTGNVLAIVKNYAAYTYTAEMSNCPYFLDIITVPEAYTLNWLCSYTILCGK